MEDPYLKHFEKMQKDHAYWLNKSADLFVTAKTLFDAMDSRSQLEVNCLSPAYMITGMAFEMLFKSVIVKKSEKPKTTHVLRVLAQDAGYKPDKSEIELLELLTEYIIWDGRYPTPKDQEHLKKHWQNMQASTFSNAASDVMQIEPNNGYPKFDRIARIYRKISETCGINT